MSLVAYGSSDESSDEEGNNCDTFEDFNCTPEEPLHKQTNEKLCLPAPKHDKIIEEVNEDDTKIHFNNLPKPISLLTLSKDIIEDDIIPPRKEDVLRPEKPTKKNPAPVKIAVPSLSDFKDVEEENETRANKSVRHNPSTKGPIALFALLPKPKADEVKATNSFIPSIVNKAKTNQTKTLAIKDKITKSSVADKTAATKTSIGIDYDSNSEDEDGIAASSTDSGADFFALSVTDTPVISDALMEELSLKLDSNKPVSPTKNSSNSSYLPTESIGAVPQKTLVSTIMNMPKEEILLKNKAEVGPKLPVPEQEYNVDIEGNVAFDEKAIEYLCGRRSIKRKAKEIDEASVIEINGEDIKPDEREWLVKALTEEPVQRPVSMMGGVNSQSKKKHQITYLAHQAKAMEMELKNQWAQNRMTRKQTQSKYGF